MFLVADIEARSGLHHSKHPRVKFAWRRDLLFVSEDPPRSRSARKS